MASEVQPPGVDEDLIIQISDTSGLSKITKLIQLKLSQLTCIAVCLMIPKLHKHTYTDRQTDRQTQIHRHTHISLLLASSCLHNVSSHMHI